MIEFTQNVFATLTFARTDSVLSTWKSTSLNYNRYIQKLRRLHNCKIEYLRVVEKHKDNYPHIHVLLQFPSAQLRITNTKFFDQALYKKWKSLWTHGLSDYQKPKRSGLGTVSYLMKYLIKNTTSNTIWKKLNPILSPSTELRNTSKPSMDSCASLLLPTHLNGVKLASWSRNFNWQPFTTKRIK